MAGLGKKSNPEKGFFITFEGPEGAGKSTQLRLLMDHLRQTFGPGAVIATREPGGTGLCERIRDLVKLDSGEKMHDETELLLFAASRAQHVRALILPALRERRIVLCDRFRDSTTAYQGYGRSFDLKLVEELNNFASCGIRPDITILLDLDPEKGMARARERDPGLFSSDRLENEKMEFHKRVRKGFLETAAREPDRIRVVDATLPQEEAHRKIRSIVDGRIGIA